VEITEVRVTLRNEEKLKAFANVTFDGEFVIRGLKVINGNKGYFVSMPSRKRADGTHQDIAHPINNAMRKKIEDRVLTAYERELRSQTTPSEPVQATVPENSVPPPTENVGGDLPGQEA
jgi:stage V sporulation protein G